MNNYMIGVLFGFAVLNLIPAIEGIYYALKSEKVNGIIAFFLYMAVLFNCMLIGAVAVFAGITEFDFSLLLKGFYGMLSILIFLIGFGTLMQMESSSGIVKGKNLFYFVLGVTDWMLALAFMFKYIILH